MLTSILAIGVLLIGSAFLSVMTEGIAGNERFSLPFGNIVVVTLLGAVLFPFAGWISTAAVLGAYAAFSVMAGLYQRFDRPPASDALDAEPTVSRQRGDQVARLIEIDQQPKPTPGPAGVYCIRCEDSQLEILPESSPRITFYSCPRCGRQYAKEPDYSLHGRWLSPLSLALYSVVQTSSRQEHATVTAESLHTSQDREMRKAIMADIADELARPKQKVREILRLVATEEDLREYLSQLSTALERLEGAKA